MSNSMETATDRSVSLEGVIALIEEHLSGVDCAAAKTELIAAVKTMPTAPKFSTDTLVCKLRDSWIMRQALDVMCGARLPYHDYKYPKNTIAALRRYELIQRDRKSWQITELGKHVLRLARQRDF